MERRPNWPAWIALALAGMALFVALGGPRRQAFMQPAYGGDVFAYRAAPEIPAVPAAPVGPQVRVEPLPYGVPQSPEFRFERRFDGPGMMHRHDGGFGSHARIELRHGGPGFGLPGFFKPLLALFALTQLAGLALMAWLVLHVLRQRNQQNLPPAPTTPAGHDPRVE